MQGCFGSAEGRAGEPHACANSPDEKRARNNQKKAKTSKFAVVKKVVKNEKTGKQQKNSKKKKKERQKGRARRTGRSQSSHKPRSSKEAGGNNKNLTNRGYIAIIKPATTNSAILQ
jgi:hypothetical protein